MPHQRGHVGAHTLCLQPLEVVAEADPVTLQSPRHGRIQRAVVNLAAPRGSRRDTAVADDLGGDSLSDGAGGPALHQEGEVGMRVNVDQTGGDEAATGIDGLPCRSLAQSADAGDPPCLNSHVAGIPGRT